MILAIFLAVQNKPLYESNKTKFKIKQFKVILNLTKNFHFKKIDCLLQYCQILIPASYPYTRHGNTMAT
jgi:hypothetical protein